MVAFHRDRRTLAAELLDGAPPGDALANLADIRRINRWFGGRRILLDLLKPFALDSGLLSVLDAGAASGDMGEAARRRYPAIRVTSLDRCLLHLGHAAPPRVAADALQLPFPPGSFDIVMANLFLHHFNDDEAARLLAQFVSVARRGVIVLDLLRHPLAYRMLGLTRPLFGWHPLTLHDGPASVAAGFRADELLSLARAAGVQNATVRTHYPWLRVSLVARTGMIA